MIEEVEFETYLSIEKNKFQIYLFNKYSLKDLYKNELKINNETNSIDLDKLSEFIDNNIFKIEKLAGTFVKNIFLIIESEEFLYVDICIKKKNYDNFIDHKYLANTLTEIKDLFKENYKEKIITHMFVNNYLINEKSYSSFEEKLTGDHLCLEVRFISISDNFIFKFEKVLEKYQIKISQSLDGSYIKDFFREEDIELSEMTHKLKNGYNNNEVIFVPKNIENKGFFEKFFQLFS
jgi:hypothetical protein